MSDGNEIKTTMTLDQQQFLREMQKQVASIAKSSRAFVEFKQEAQRAGQGVKGAMDQGLASVKNMAMGLTGVTSVLAGVQKAVQLVIADFEKGNRRAVEAIDSTRTPANAYRKLFANAPPERRDQLMQEVAQISQKTGARFEQVAPVLGGAYSSLANLDPKYAGEAASVALRWFPDDPQAAEEIASRSLGLMSSEKQQGREVNPEQIIGSLFEMMQASMIRSAEQTFKSGMPGVAALAQSGMSVRKAEGFFAGMTNLNQDLTGERTKSTLQNLPSGMRTFSPETDQHRRERIREQYLEALDVVDTRPKRRDELVRQLDDRHITDPEQLAPVAAGMLRQQAELYAPGSDKRRRLEEKTALVEKAGTHLRGRDPQGQDLDVPVAQYREFQNAGDIEDKLRVAGKHRELGQSLLSHLSINATSEEALTKLIEGDKARWAVIDAAIEKIHDADERSAARLRAELAKLESNRLIIMSGAQRRLEQAVQKVELASTLDQQFGLAKKTVEAMHAKNPTGVVSQWIDTSLKPIFEQHEAKRDPIGVAVPKLQAELQRIEKELTEGRLIFPPAEGAFSGPKPLRFEQLQGQEREQREYQRDFTRSLIEMLESNKAEMAPQPQPVKIEPVQQAPQPVKIERGQPQPVPVGQKVGKLITSPIKQRLRPDLDFLTVDTDDTIARQMALAQQPKPVALSERETRSADFISEGHDYGQLVREHQEDEEFRRQRAEEHDAHQLREHERLVAWPREPAASQWFVEPVPVQRPEQPSTPQQRIAVPQHQAIVAIHPQLRTPQERIREDVIDRAMETAESAGLKNVTRVGLEQSAEQWGEDTTGFAKHIAGFFSHQADQRHDAAREAEINVDPNTGEGTPFVDPSVDRLYRAAGQIEDAPIRELQRTDSQRQTIDLLAKAKWATTVAAVPRVPVPPEPEPVRQLFPAPSPVESLPLPQSVLALFGKSGDELPDVMPAETLQTSVVRLPRPAITPKPYKPSDPERTAKAWAAVEASHQPRAEKPIPVKKPFVPSDPERFVKATAAVEQSRVKQRLTSAERREGLNQPLMAAFQGDVVGKPVAANPVEINPAFEIVTRSARPPAPGDYSREQGRQAMREADQARPSQVVDTKPVVNAIERQTTILEQLLKATQANQQQPRPSGTSSNAGRERTTTRPAAALAK